MQLLFMSLAPTGSQSAFRPTSAIVIKTAFGCGRFDVAVATRPLLAANLWLFRF